VFPVTVPGVPLIIATAALVVPPWQLTPHPLFPVIVLFPAPPKPNWTTLVSAA
jgi:hypothetical protein